MKSIFAGKLLKKYISDEKRSVLVKFSKKTLRELIFNTKQIPKIVPIKVEKKFQKDNFILRRSIDILYGKKIIDLIINKKPNIIVCAQIPLDPLLKIMTFCKKNNIKIIFWMQDIYSVAISKILNKKFPLIGKLIGKYYFRVEKKCENMPEKLIEMLEYAENLSYEETPSYDYLYFLIKTL